MTKEEAAIVAAYTGIMIGDFSVMHDYVEKKLDRPVFTHEFADRETVDQIKEKTREDFISLKVE